MSLHNHVGHCLYGACLRVLLHTCNLQELVKQELNLVLYYSIDALKQMNF